MIKHRALGLVSLPCGKWPAFIDRKNMVYCSQCLAENTIDVDGRSEPEREDAPPQDLPLPEV